eukprot:tig00000691_g3162.t1
MKLHPVGGASGGTHRGLGPPTGKKTGLSDYARTKISGEDLASGRTMSFWSAEVEQDFSYYFGRRSLATVRVFLAVELLVYVATGVYFMYTPLSRTRDSGGDYAQTVRILHFYISTPLHVIFLALTYTSIIKRYRELVMFFAFCFELAIPLAMSRLVPDEISQMYVVMMTSASIFNTACLTVRWHIGAAVAAVAWAVHIIIQLVPDGKFFLSGSLNYIPGYLVAFGAIVIGLRVGYSFELVSRRGYILERFGGDGLKIPLIGGPGVEPEPGSGPEELKVNGVLRRGGSVASEVSVIHVMHDELPNFVRRGSDAGERPAVGNLGIDVELTPAEIEKFKRLDFDVFSVPISKLVAHVVNMFEAAGLVERFRIPRDILCNFVGTIAMSYNPVPYHNVHHAFDVTQTVYFLYMTARESMDMYLRPIDVLGLFTAAVAHDVDHPGLNNVFQVSTKSRLAYLYNDQSVLENHHCSLAFQILSRPETNIFCNLSDADFTEVRRIVVYAILATDMQKHFDIVKKFKARLAVTESQPVPEGEKRRWLEMDEKEDRRMLVEIILKCADISNVVKPFPIAKRWGDVLQEEFFHQGDKERELGLPVSPMCDRRVVVQAQSQLGFSNAIAQPLWNDLVKVFGELQECITNLQGNAKTWLSVLELGSAAMASHLSSASASGPADK